MIHDSPQFDAVRQTFIRETPAGLYCGTGDFFIDPWLPVSRAVVTHAHADHARPGSRQYLCAAEGRALLQTRLGPAAAIETVPYGEAILLNGVRVSLHPAGHILGSAQVRLEQHGEVWVVSGDYKTAPDPTCRQFELVRCHTFVTESTFGLPIYRWPAQAAIWQSINDWWRTNASEGRASVIFAYALGKTQRVLAGLDPGIGPIFCHGAVDAVNSVYRESAVALPEAAYVGTAPERDNWAGSMILAPPSAMGSVWLRRFGEIATAFVSGWMLIRGARRRRTVDRGFALSDHADWTALQETIRGTGAEQVFVTHGQVNSMVRWLFEQGIPAAALHTEFEGEQDEGV
jgi:putative mRNA 3-end processing factor